MICYTCIMRLLWKPFNKFPRVILERLVTEKLVTCHCSPFIMQDCMDQRVDSINKYCNIILCTSWIFLSRSSYVTWMTKYRILNSTCIPEYVLIPNAYLSVKKIYDLNFSSPKVFYNFQAVNNVGILSKSWHCGQSYKYIYLYNLYSFALELLIES